VLEALGVGYFIRLSRNIFAHPAILLACPCQPTRAALCVVEKGKGRSSPGGRERAEAATSELLSRPLSVCSNSAPYLGEDSHKRLAIVMIPEGV